MSNVGDSMIKGALEALAFAKGEADPNDYQVHIPAEIDVRRIREGLGMSQAEFAEHFGFSIRTIQEWEQGRRVPSGASRSYLTVIAREPDAVQRALTSRP